MKAKERKSKRRHKKILKVFKPKPAERVLEDYCNHYGFTYPVSSVDDLKNEIRASLKKNKEEKHYWVKEQNFEKGAACRDKERDLEQHLTCFELGSFDELALSPTFREWIKYVTLQF